MSVSFWLDQTSENQKRNFDVCIVGAGIAGLSTAYWLLQKEPNLKIALLEKHQISYGASGRNAGFITCGSVEHFNRLVQTHGEDLALEIWSFSERNLSLLKERIIRNDKNLDFEQNGSFSLASTEKEFEELKKTAEIMNSHNVPIETLSSQEIEQRLGAVHFAGGIKYVSDASINPALLCQKIWKKIAHQTTLFEICEVSHFEKMGSQSIIRTSNGDFQSDLIILATNAYSSLFDSYFSDKIYPTKGQMLCLEPSPKVMEGPCYANFVLDYFRQLPSGELLIGGFRQLEKETEVGYSDHITPRIQEALHDFVRKYLPQFKDSKVTHRWAGIMGFSADGQPMIGSLPNNPQIFFLGGFTAHGLGLAFHTAEKLVRLIWGESIPDFISARRF